MISFPAPLALALPEHPTLAESVQFQLTGLLVVLLTLGSLALLVGLIGRIFAALESRRIGSPPASPTPVREERPDHAPEEIPAPVLAAIAGAVAAALNDSRFAIRGVQMADPSQNLAWSAEGRRSIYASRNVR